MSPKEIVALKNGMRNATPSAWIYGSLSFTEAHCLSFLSLQIFRALLAANSCCAQTGSLKMAS